MNRLPVLALSVLVLAGASAPVCAQDYPGDTVYSQPAYGQTSQSDYARVIRVDPVLDGYATSSTQRCYERPTYVTGENGGYDDG